MTEKSHCPSHPNPHCPLENGEGVCGLCGYDFTVKHLDREKAKAAWAEARRSGEAHKETKSREELEVLQRRLQELERQREAGKAEDAKAEAAAHEEIQRQKRLSEEARKATQEAKREKAEEVARLERKLQEHTRLAGGRQIGAGLLALILVWVFVPGIDTAVMRIFENGMVDRKAYGTLKEWVPDLSALQQRINNELIDPSLSKRALNTYTSAPQDFIYSGHPGLQSAMEEWPQLGHMYCIEAPEIWALLYNEAYQTVHCVLNIVGNATRPLFIVYKGRHLKSEGVQQTKMHVVERGEIFKTAKYQLAYSRVHDDDIKQMLGILTDPRTYNGH